MLQLLCWQCVGGACLITYEEPENNSTTDFQQRAGNVSYAVAICGIQKDAYLDSNGDEQTAGLTFGPATGEDYTSTDSNSGGYCAHAEEDGANVVTSENFIARTAAEAETDGTVYCIHWLTWEQIIKQSKTDPTVFKECFESGCTHSVELTINSTLADSDYEYSAMTGDGASVLYNSIAANYRQWNGSNTTGGGWSSSKIRATLNDTSYGLITCFPSVLQDNIVGKMISSPIAYDGENDVSDNWMTTNDKLWLFSLEELFSENSKYATPISLIHYTEAGDTGNSWLISLGSTAYVYGIDRTGSVSGGYATSTCGLAPGFCIP